MLNVISFFDHGAIIARSSIYNTNKHIYNYAFMCALSFIGNIIFSFLSMSVIHTLFRKFYVIFFIVIMTVFVFLMFALNNDLYVHFVAKAIISVAQSVIAIYSMQWCIFFSQERERLDMIDKLQFTPMLGILMGYLIEINVPNVKLSFILEGSFLVIGVIVLFILVKFIVKLKSDKDEEKLREQNKKDLINYVSNTYLNELKRFDGKTAVLDAIKKIRSDIDNSTVGENEKSIRRRAIEIAEERYNQYKATCTIEEYKSLFNSLDAKKIFNNWNASNDDSEMKRGLCNEFMTKINDYNKFATEAYNSNNEKDEIAKMFKIYVKPLENTANQVKVLSQAELQEDIKNYLIDISEKYMDLSKKFEKGEF